MNDTMPQNHNLKDEVLKKIETGQVSMRPKAYFVLKIFLLLFVAFLVFITSVLLISYILFSINVGCQFLLLGFGARGVIEFLEVFPWLLLALNVVLLLTLDLLLKRFKFGYNRSILYLFLGTMVVITLFGSLVNITSFHRRLMYSAEGKHLPMFSGFYSGLRGSHHSQGIFRGVVASTSLDSFTLRRNDYDVDLDDTPIKVFTPANIDISNFLTVGDHVFIAGDLINGEIHAYGITIVSE